MDAGVPPREMAVLVRVNAQTERFERAFADAGVPCQVRGAERFFDRAEVRQAIGPAAGRRRARPGAPDESGALAAAAGARACGARSARARGARPDQWSRRRARGSARERWESLAALAQLARTSARPAPGAGWPTLSPNWPAAAAIEHAPAVDGVTVASLHAAKGLEWDVVFLPGLTEGNLPIVHAQTDAAVAEERRLLYVGVTRARQQVCLSWALARSPGGRPSRKPSRFLDGLRPGGRAARLAGYGASIVA